MLSLKFTKPVAALLATVFLVFGIFIGRLTVATPANEPSDELQVSKLIDAEASGMSVGDGEIAEAERSLNDLEAEYDAAMDDLYSSASPSGYMPDPELQRGQRQAVELNEMICKQTGQNCEAAALARRHYEETYGPM